MNFKKNFKKSNKYNSIVSTYNGFKFHSRSEAKYAEILDSLIEQGSIKSYTKQVRYPLPNREGKMRMAYIADFVVTGNSGKEYIIDVKGMLTPETNVKLAYFRHYYGKEVDLVYTTGAEKFRTTFLV